MTVPNGSRDDPLLELSCGDFILPLDRLCGFFYYCNFILQRAIKKEGTRTLNIAKPPYRISSMRRPDPFIFPIRLDSVHGFPHAFRSANSSSRSV